MKTLITIVFVLIGSVVQAQLTTIKTYKFDNGFVISLNDDIKLGKSKSKESYDYIYNSVGFWGKKEGLTSNQKGTFKVEKLLKFGDGKYPIIQAGITVNNKRYTVEIVKAIESGEIVVDSKYKEGLEYHFELSDISIKDNEPFYETIIDLDKTYSKSTLYNSAKQTFIKVFNDANEVIQYENESEGVIIAKGFTKAYFIAQLGLPQDYRMWFLCKISVKDGKYRVQLYEHNVEIYYSASSYGNAGYHPFSVSYNVNKYLNGRKGEKRIAKDFLESFHKENIRVINAITTNMLSTSIDNNNDDW